MPTKEAAAGEGEPGEEDADGEGDGEGEAAEEAPGNFSIYFIFLYPLWHLVCCMDFKS